MNILLSLSYNPTINAISGRYNGSNVTTQRRSSDWGKSGLAKHLLYITESFHLLRQARRFDTLVLCTVGMEAFIAGGLKKILCPKTKIVCADFLMPRESRSVSLVVSWLNGIDSFICIRRGDIMILGRRFNVPAAKCHFAYFPANEALVGIKTEQGDYIYSAGIAHRDWATLIAALGELPYKATLSVGVPVQVPPQAEKYITLLPMQSPEEGRKLMAGAKIVILSLEDTDLPSGPLVLLDAMAMGKPIIATRVNGTRDYISNGEDGILVAPKESAALAAMIRNLMGNDALCEKMGQAAQTSAMNKFTQTGFFDSVSKVCEHVCREAF